MFASILKARVPQVRGRVYRARVWPVQGQDKPALCVYGYDEEKTLTGVGGYQHVFSVRCPMTVLLRCEGVNAAEQEANLEALAHQIERVILAAPEFWAQDLAAIPLEKCARVSTQFTAAQREQTAEVEAAMIFDLQWSEEYEMADPDTCDDVSIVYSYPDFP